MICWLHFGDVHASNEDGWRSDDDLAALARQAATAGPGSLDFASLPGDIATHGTAEQFAWVCVALGSLTLPWFAIPGDHDLESGTMDSFYAGLGAAPLPLAVTMGGRRCLFLDIVSGGSGDPVFRLGAQQTVWLRDQLAASRHDAGAVLVFMHALPSDLAEDVEAVGQLFADHDVATVDTGHTRTNELINDGTVIYTATRSTGQIEEGPVSASFHAVDGSVVSTRFKELAQPWPVVLIMSPADHRLITDPTRRDQIPGGGFAVRAKVFGDEEREVALTVGDGAPVAMTRRAGCVWSANVTGVDDGEHRLAVTAVGGAGTRDGDAIIVRLSQAAVTERLAVRVPPGHARHTIGAWPEHGLRGTRHGPDKNGREW